MGTPALPHPGAGRRVVAAERVGELAEQVVVATGSPSRRLRRSISLAHGAGERDPAAGRGVAGPRRAGSRRACGSPTTARAMRERLVVVNAGPPSAKANARR